MATATVKTKLVPQPPILTPVPDKVEKVGVTLELTMKEANVLRAILGTRAGYDGVTSGNNTNDIYAALNGAALYEELLLRVEVSGYNVWKLVSR